MSLPQLPDLQELEQLFQEAYSAFISGRANAISTIQNTYNELNNYFNQLIDNCTIYQNIQAKLADYKDYLNNYTNNIISPMSYTIENVLTILDESTSPTLQNICEECLCYDDNRYSGSPASARFLRYSLLSLYTDLSTTCIYSSLKTSTSDTVPYN